MSYWPAWLLVSHQSCPAGDGPRSVKHFCPVSGSHHKLPQGYDLCISFHWLPDLQPQVRAHGPLPQGCQVLVHSGSVVYECGVRESSPYMICLSEQIWGPSQGHSRKQQHTPRPAPTILGGGTRRRSDLSIRLDAPLQPAPLFCFVFLTKRKGSLKHLRSPVHSCFK